MIFLNLLKESYNIWLTGGWSMIAIAITSIIMFSLGINVYLKLLSKGFYKVSEKKTRNWIKKPKKCKNSMHYLMVNIHKIKDKNKISYFFRELDKIEIAPFKRDLIVMNVCVSCAPLLGLLGTVTGMLSTFSALATGSGGDKTMGMIASGISEALITTETGLIIALAGLFFRYYLVQKLESYKIFLAHLETIFTQEIIRKEEKHGKI